MVSRRHDRRPVRRLSPLRGVRLRFAWGASGGGGGAGSDGLCDVAQAAAVVGSDRGDRAGCHCLQSGSDIYQQRRQHTGHGLWRTRYARHLSHRAQLLQCGAYRPLAGGADHDARSSLAGHRLWKLRRLLRSISPAVLGKRARPRPQLFPEYLRRNGRHRLCRLSRAVGRDFQRDHPPDQKSEYRTQTRTFNFQLSPFTFAHRLARHLDPSHRASPLRQSVCSEFLPTARCPARHPHQSAVSS